MSGEAMGAASGADDGATGGMYFPPAAILSIAPASVPRLTDQQKKLVVILKKRIRLLQEYLLSVAGETDGASSEKVSETARIVLQSTMVPKLTSPLTGHELHWVGDALTLIRYLRAREWHTKKAFELLVETIIFRRQWRPERIQCATVRDLGMCGALYRRGYDRNGRPLIYLRPSRFGYDDPDEDKVIRLLIYTIERALASANRMAGVYTVNLLVDYNNYEGTKQPPLYVALKFIDIFQNYYPEHLGYALVCDAPWHFSTFWAIVKPFLPTKTINKVKFLTTTKPADAKILTDIVAPEFLEPWIPNGLAPTPPSDWNAYWDQEALHFKEHMLYLQEEFVKKTPAQRAADIKELIKEAKAQLAKGQAPPPYPGAPNDPKYMPKHTPPTASQASGQSEADATENEKFIESAEALDQELEAVEANLTQNEQNTGADISLSDAANDQELEEDEQKRQKLLQELDRLKSEEK